MNKVVTGLLAVAGVVGVGVLGLIGVIAMQPSHVHVERSAVVGAAPADVYPFANDLSLWMKWNPWDAMEPSAVKTFSENPVGVGAFYTWKGEQTGSGKMTIASTVPDQNIVYDLQFTEPFVAKADVSFTFTPDAAGTKVVWAYDADAGFMEKAAGLFMDMDGMLGGDFERGLKALGPLAEASGKERLAREAAAVAPPPAPLDAATGAVVDALVPPAP